MIFVACVAAKATEPRPAGELYCSVWFQKARAWTLSRGSSWRILSAEHGLVHPDEVIAPYNTTLNTMPAAARRAWARRVLHQLDAELAPCHVTILAGRRYREHLLAPMMSRGFSVDVPMAGLGIGQQLAWLS